MQNGKWLIAEKGIEESGLDAQNWRPQTRMK
jgi:hypothetical protein